MSFIERLKELDEETTVIDCLRSIGAVVCTVAALKYLISSK